MSNLHAATDAAIERAAEILRSRGLVAFPTETVYGLGANALSAEAVRRIFAAKGRPATNPVIVHIADAAQVPLVACDVPPIVETLAAKFWPGPLTLVLRRGSDIPDEVTGGGPTVAVRVPAHPVAHALLRTAGIPLAAPSANRSTALSPTTAAHVAASLGDAVEMILDGGPCPGGIESTVLDVTKATPRILRPGPITAAMLEPIVGRLATDAVKDAIARSPGQMARHYAPRTPLQVADDDGRSRVRDLLAEGRKVGWLTWPDAGSVDGAIRRELPCHAAGYAAGLYAALHDLDAVGCDRIIVAQPPDGPEWQAIHDRLRRASS